ncbi:MAG: MarR family transcriptional regulator [Clostridiales bacterium]|nr:MarR family transcriptional regulator [Clostridiales bacterium]
MRYLEQHFNTMYDKFKLMLYDRALKERGRSMPGDLSLQEVIYMEIIIALGDPTVAEFSRYAKLSASNTAYRLNKLEERGYIRRIRNDRDKREYRVEATSRYREEYGVIFDYIHLVCERIEDRFEPADVDKFEEMLGIISEELMPEAGRQLRDRDYPEK